MKLKVILSWYYFLFLNSFTLIFIIINLSYLHIINVIVLNRYSSKLYKLKVQFIPLKYARNCPPSKSLKTSKFSRYRKLIKSNRKRTVRQRFFSQQIRLFPFFTIGHNDRGYGHLAVCGSVRCRGTTK